MKNTKSKIIVILGQTSTGKSDFAVEIARALAVSGIKSEIISADSRQVYKGMDLGTGKITKKEMRGIPHHMLNVANPKKVFTVSDYQKLANKKIEEIIKRGNIPILCGGTGFYIDAVVDGTVLPEVPPNKKLRILLAKRDKKELYAMLKRLDKVRAESIDKDNPVRLIRAIEIATHLGSVPPPCTSPTGTEYNVLKIGLNIHDELLKERIYTRIIKRIKKGMIKEIANLHIKGVSWKRMYDLGLEYRYISQFLQGEQAGKIGKERKKEMIDKLNSETWAYAKRQKTWFKRDKSTLWLDPNNKTQKKDAFKKVKDFLS